MRKECNSSVRDIRCSFLRNCLLNKPSFFCGKDEIAGDERGGRSYLEIMEWNE